MDHMPLILNGRMELFKRERGDDSNEGGVGGGKLKKRSIYKFKGILRDQENERKVLKSIEFKNPHIVSFDNGSQKTDRSCFDVTQDLGKMDIENVYNNVIGLAAFSNCDLGWYIEKIKKNSMSKGGCSVFHFS